MRQPRSRFVKVLTCVTALHLACAPPAKPRAGAPEFAPRATLPPTACEGKAERTAQAAHACLTSIPAHMPVSEDKTRPILSEFCPPGERDGRMGCAGCAPNFVTSSAQPEAFSEVLGLLEGSFTGPDRSEVLLTFAPCEAEQTQLLLFRRELGRFVRVDAPPLASASRCTASPLSQGYSRLACAGGVPDVIGAATSAEAWVDLLDLRLGRSQRVLSVQGNLRAACADGKRTWLHDFSVYEARFRDLDGDGRDDLWLRALWASGAEPVGYDAHCRDLFLPPPDWMAVAADLRDLSCELPETTCGTLEFWAQDDSFRPSAATARVLAEFDTARTGATPRW